MPMPRLEICAKLLVRDSIPKNSRDSVLAPGRVRKQVEVRIESRPDGQSSFYLKLVYFRNVYKMKTIQASSDYLKLMRILRQLFYLFIVI